MINNEAFYAMMPDAIGTVTYRWKGKNKPMSNQEEQDFIDNYTREAMNVLINKARFSYEVILPPHITYFNARQDARVILDKMGPNVELKSESLQIGNKECLDYVFKLQSNQDFRGWVNPGLIELYIRVTQELLKKQK